MTGYFHDKCFLYLITEENAIENTDGKIGGQSKRPKGPHIVHLSTMCHLF